MLSFYSHFKAVAFLICIIQHSNSSEMTSHGGTSTPLRRFSPAVNASSIQAADVVEVLSRVQSELPDLRVQILFDNHHENIIYEMKKISQDLFRGLVLYSYDGTKTTFAKLPRIAATQRPSLIFVLTTPLNAMMIFRMIWRERVESHFAHWLLITSDEKALSTFVLGLSGIIQEGTRVSLLFKEHNGEFSLFYSRVDGDGIVRLFPNGKWYKEKRDNKRTSNRFISLAYPDTKSFYHNMRGRELKVAANDFEGFFRLDNTFKDNIKSSEGEEGMDKTGGRQPLLGIDGAIVQTLSVALNFTYKIIRPADGYWGNPLPNGTVTGVIGLSARREASFSICAIAITELRDTVVDFTHPYFIEPLALFSRAPRQKNKVLAVLSPFDLKVWLSLFAMALAIGPFVSLQWKTSDCLLKEKSNPGLQSLSFNVFRSLVIQGNKIQTGHFSLRITFISWYLFCLIVSSLYSGMLTAVLAIPAYEEPIDSLVDLPRAAGDGFSIGILKDTANEMLFREATNGIYRQTWLLFDHKDPPESFVTRPEIGIQRAMERKYVFIGFKISNELLVFRLGRRKFHIGKQDIFPLRIAIACPPGVPYKSTFDIMLLRMVEGGLFSKWRSDEFTKVSLGALGNQEDSNKTYAISLVHLQAAFFIVVIGFLVASVVLMFEQIMPNLS